MAAPGLLRKNLFPPILISYLRYQFIFTFENIHPPDNFKGKTLFLTVVLERKRVMLRSIAPAIILKNSRKKTTLQVFFVLSIWPVSPSSIYGTLLLPLMLLTTTAKKKTLFAEFADLFAWNCGPY